MHFRFNFTNTIGLLSLLWLLLPGSLWADDFTFSFTNAVGPVSGTVTGEILGLTNNATSAASEVIIASLPAPLAAADLVLSNPPINATTWAVQGLNVFTETSGIITSADFFAAPAHPTDNNLEICFNACNSTTFATLGFPGEAVIANARTMSFSPLASPVPEPSTPNLTLIGFGSLGLMMVMRKRIAKAHPQAT
jgi:hypothetical protein